MGKIPERAKRVFKGVIYDVYHWEQELYDCSTATFEMLKRPDTLQVLPIQGDKILLAFESQPLKQNYYACFGGKREGDEDHLAGAQREFLEETGMKSERWEFWKKYTISSHMEWDVHFFIAHDVKKIQEQRLEGGEKIEIKSFTFDEFVDVVCSENFIGREFACDIMRMRLENRLEELKNRLFG